MPDALLVVNASALIFLGNAGISNSCTRWVQAGLSCDPRAVLLELRTANMWLSDAVIARVLRTAGIKS